MKPKLVNIYKFHLCPTLLRRRESNPGLSALWPTTLPTWLSNPPRDISTQTFRSIIEDISVKLLNFAVCYYMWLSEVALYQIISTITKQQKHISISSLCLQISRDPWHRRGAKITAITITMKRFSMRISNISTAVKWIIVIIIFYFHLNTETIGTVQ